MDLRNGEQKSLLPDSAERYPNTALTFQNDPWQLISPKMLSKVKQGEG